MKTTFELLPTEIYFEIFDYLSTFDLFYAGFHLNQRLNDVIGSYDIHLDIQRISRLKFDFICRCIRPEQTISIYFSDEFMPNQVELFQKAFLHCQDRFVRLRNVHFNNTSTILKNLPTSLSDLEIKMYLKTTDTDGHIWEILDQQAQCLTHLNVDGSYAFRSINVSFPLLTHLIINYCTISKFHRILRSLQSPLTHLKLNLENEAQSAILQLNSLADSLVDLTLIFSEDILMSFDLIQRSISQLSKLRRLIIQATGALDLLDGQLWEEYFSSRKKLRKFHFKFTLAKHLTCEQDRQSLLQPFRSSFWIEEKRWFVACDKRELPSSRPTMYSIPYFHPSFLFYPSNHTSPTSNAENLMAFKHSSHLIVSFLRNTELPSRPFSNIHTLTLLTDTVPSIETLQTIVNLQEIRELDASLIQTFSADDFRVLIEEMTNLKSVKMIFDPLYIPPLHICSYTFVRKYASISAIDADDIDRFCYLFFHVTDLEINVPSKSFISHLLNQLHYLESIKIYSYQDSMDNIDDKWLKQNVPRLGAIHFTHRMTSSCLFLSIGHTRMTIDETIVKKRRSRAGKRAGHRSIPKCVIQ